MSRGFGLGIALSGTPKDAMRLSEAQGRMRAQQEMASQQAQAKREQKEKEEVDKILNSDFKLDNKMYHKKLIPNVIKTSKDYFQRILDEKQKSGSNWENVVPNIILEYRGELKKYQDQSKTFSDYEALDPNKYHQDPEFVKILNSNPGDLSDIEAYSEYTRGLRGVGIGKDGQVFFTPTPKIDRYAYIDQFNKMKGAYQEESGGSERSGIPGVRNIVTNNVPQKSKLEELTETALNDPTFIASTLWETPIGSIPSSVSINDPASVAAFGQAAAKDFFTKNITPYKTLAPHNVPKDADGKAQPVTGYIHNPKTNGWEYRSKNSVWSTAYDPNEKAYLMTVRTFNDKGEVQDQRPLDWTHRTADGAQVSSKGRLMGFYYYPDRNEFNAVITEDKSEAISAGSQVDNANLTAVERSMVQHVANAAPANKQTVVKPKNIQWSPETEQIIEQEWGEEPLSVMNQLLKKQFKFKMNQEGNQIIVNKKPKNSGFSWDDKKDDDVKPATPRTIEAVGDSAAKSGFWND